MKKLIYLALALILMIGTIGLSACGGNGGETDNSPEAAPADETPASNDETGEPSSGDGMTWSDIPVYPGADQSQQASWTMAIPADEEGWSDVAWRYYETSDSSNDVIDFYKDEMPDNGWDEMSWMEASGYAVGYYVKNNEQDGAMFWCGEEDGKTVFALMRSAQ